ncbi:MAG: trypsin-like peptidase domain-containing protein [Pseudomonadota bacterium]
MKTISLFTFASSLVLSGMAHAQSNGVVVQTTNQPAAALSDEHIANATPMPMPQLTLEQIKSLIERNGGTYVQPAAHPKVPKNESSPVITPGVPIEVGNPAYERPYWNVGRIITKMSDGNTYSCTAQFIGSVNVVLTAAHCLWDTNANGLSLDVTMTRGKGGSGSQKITFTCAIAFSEFDGSSSNPNYAYDYALLYAGQPSQAGFLNYSTNAPQETIMSVGYPQNYGNMGKLYEVQGYLDGPASKAGMMQMDQNPFSKGSSGGAWIYDLTKLYGTGNQIVGINALEQISGSSGYEDNVWSPAFDSTYFPALVNYVTSTKCQSPYSGPSPS